MTTPASGSPVSVGLIGAGRMGSFHAETLARRLPRTRLIPRASHSAHWTAHWARR